MVKQSKGKSPAASVDSVAEKPDARRASAWFWPAFALICLIAAAARFMIMAEYVAENPFAEHLRVDALTYWDWAGRIAGGQWRETTPFFSAPLYPYLLGLVRICGGGVNAVYVIQILMDLTTAVVLGLLVRRRFGAGVGLLAPALYLLLLEPASFSLRVLTCSLQLLLIVTAWTSLVAVQERRTLTRCVLSGVAVGLLTLAYPPALLVTVGLGAWLLLSGWGQRGNVASAGLAVFVSLAVMFPALLHNYLVSGTVFPVQAVSGVTLRQGNGPGADGGILMIPGTSTDREWLFPTAKRCVEAQLGRPATWAEVDRHYRNEVLDWWKANPGATAKLVLLKAYRFLTSRHYGEIYLPTVEIETGLTGRLRLTPLHVAWLLPLSLIAAVVWLRRWREHVPELMLLGVPILVTLLFRFSPRYRLPAIPIIVVGAAWVLVLAWQRRRQPIWPVLAAAAVAVGLGLSAVNSATRYDTQEFVEPDFERWAGLACAEAGDNREAETHLRRACELRPNWDEAELTLADLLRRTERPAEALELTRRVLNRDPDNCAAHDLQGVLLMAMNVVSDAAYHFQRALELDRNRPGVLNNYARVLSAQGRHANAVEFYREALDIFPLDFRAHYGLAQSFQALGRHEEALEHFEIAVRLEPSQPALRREMAAVRQSLGDVDGAAESLRLALRIEPRFSGARADLAYLLIGSGDLGGAIEMLREGVRLQPDDVLLANDLAWLLAAAPHAELRDGAEALRLARHIIDILPEPRANHYDTLAAAFAEVGQFDEAISAVGTAIELARAIDAADERAAALIQRLEGRLELYRAGRPFRESP